MSDLVEHARTVFESAVQAGHGPLIPMAVGAFIGWRMFRTDGWLDRLDRPSKSTYPVP